MRKIIATVALALAGLGVAAPANAAVGDTTHDGGTVLSKTFLGCGSQRCAQERTVGYNGAHGYVVVIEHRSFPIITRGVARNPLPGHEHPAWGPWHVRGVRLG